MKIFDGHADILTGVLQRRLRGETQVLAKRHLPLLKKGGIAGGAWVLWVDPPYTSAPKERMRALLKAVQDELAETEDVVLIHGLSDWQAAEKAQKFPVLLGAEGLDAAESIGDLQVLHAFGVRQVMLTWNGDNAFAGGAKGAPERGLTALGREALRFCEDKRLIVDVSHLNDRSFWDVLARVHGPVIASHSNARAENPVPRNLDDEQLRAIAETGGIVGLNANKNLVSADVRAQNLDTFARHAVHIAGTIGVEHVAFGFDFNEYLDASATKSYNDGANPNVPGLEDASKAQAFASKLRAVGFTEAELEMIACKNWQRVMAEVLG